MINAFTPGTVDTMLRDLNRRPLHPLLLWDKPLAEQLHPSDAYLIDLYLLELSPWIPSPRNPPYLSEARDIHRAKLHSVAKPHHWFPYLVPEALIFEANVKAHDLQQVVAAAAPA